MESGKNRFVSNQLQLELVVYFLLKFRQMILGRRTIMANEYLSHVSVLVRNVKYSEFLCYASRMLIKCRADRPIKPVAGAKN